MAPVRWGADFRFGSMAVIGFTEKESAEKGLVLLLLVRKAAHFPVCGAGLMNHYSLADFYEEETYECNAWLQGARKKNRTLI